MQNFTFYTPTRIAFGEDTQKQVGELLQQYGISRVLLHYGSGSIQKNGLYDQVVSSLQQAKISFCELGGVTPNPKLSLVREGIALCRAEDVELVLAVGGGSVIDSSKAIAAGVPYEGDVWDFFEKKAAPQKALPVATVLTLAASGSEMSSSAVITHEEKQLKRGFNSDYNRPLFSICNPALTYTLPPYQTACGTVDIMMHTLERYFGNSPQVDVTDRIAESVLKATIRAGREALQNPENYEARATLMWAGSLSHNDLTCCGRSFFMVCHQMEHEISGMFDRVAHGAGLAVVFLAWAKYVYLENPFRFAQYAHRVWNCDMDFSHPEKTAREGIEKTEAYFRSLGMPTRLSELSIPVSSFDEMAEKCTYWGKRTLGGIKELDKEDILRIFHLAE